MLEYDLKNQLSYLGNPDICFEVPCYQNITEKITTLVDWLISGAAAINGRSLTLKTIEHAQNQPGSVPCLNVSPMIVQ